MKKFLILSILSILSIARAQTPVLFSLQSLTGTVNNRQITVWPDSAQNPMWFGSNLVSLAPFPIQPINGQVITNLQPWGYSFRVDGWPRAVHIVVPSTTNTVNVVDLINTNQFSPLNIYYVGGGGSGTATNLDGAATNQVTDLALEQAQIVASTNVSGTFSGTADQGQLVYGTPGSTIYRLWYDGQRTALWWPSQDGGLTQGQLLYNPFTAGAGPTWSSVTNLSGFSISSNNFTGQYPAPLLAGTVPLPALANAVTNKTFISPMQFGAAGDGATDDSVAWSNTIAALNAGPIRLLNGQNRTFMVNIQPPPVTASNVVMEWFGLTTTNDGVSLLNRARSQMYGNDLTVRNAVIWRQGSALPQTNSIGINLNAGGTGYYENVTVENTRVVNFYRDLVDGQTTQLRIENCHFNMFWSNCIYGCPGNSDMAVIRLNDVLGQDGMPPLPGEPAAQTKQQLTNSICFQFDGGNLGIRIEHNNGGWCKQAMLGSGLIVAWWMNEFEHFETVNTNQAIFTLTNNSIVNYIGNGLDMQVGGFGSSNYMAQFGLYNCPVSKCKFSCLGYPVFDLLASDGSTSPYIDAANTYTLQTHVTFGDVPTIVTHNQGTIPFLNAGNSWYGANTFYTSPNFQSGVWPGVGLGADYGASSITDGTQKYGVICGQLQNSASGKSLPLISYRDYGAGYRMAIGGEEAIGSTPMMDYITFYLGGNSYMAAWQFVDSGDFSPLKPGSIGGSGKISAITGTNFVALQGGSYTGNGAGLTNLPAQTNAILSGLAGLPSTNTIVYTNSSGVTLAGTFNGLFNGSNALALASSTPLSVLNSNAVAALAQQIANAVALAMTNGGNLTLGGALSAGLLTEPGILTGTNFAGLNITNAISLIGSLFTIGSKSSGSQYTYLQGTSGALLSGGPSAEVITETGDFSPHNNNLSLTLGTSSAIWSGSYVSNFFVYGGLTLISNLPPANPGEGRATIWNSNNAAAFSIKTKGGVLSTNWLFNL